MLLGGTGYAATQLKTDFIGSSGENTLQATLTMPTGTRLADTDAQAREIEAWLAGNDDVSQVWAVRDSVSAGETIDAADLNRLVVTINQQTGEIATEVRE